MVFGEGRRPSTVWTRADKEKEEIDRWRSRWTIQLSNILPLDYPNEVLNRVSDAVFNMYDRVKVDTFPHDNIRRLLKAVVRVQDDLERTGIRSRIRVEKNLTGSNFVTFRIYVESLLDQIILQKVDEIEDLIVEHLNTLVDNPDDASLMMFKHARDAVIKLKEMKDYAAFQRWKAHRSSSFSYREKIYGDILGKKTSSGRGSSAYFALAQLATPLYSKRLEDLQRNTRSWFSRLRVDGEDYGDSWWSDSDNAKHYWDTFRSMFK